MRTLPGFDNECIAYALAVGLVTLDADTADRELEKSRRRQRRIRIRNQKAR